MSISSLTLFLFLTFQNNSFAYASKVFSQCDPAIEMSLEEREELLSELTKTRIGTQVLSDFKKIYGTLDALALQWDSVSYSKILDEPKTRGLASVDSAAKLGSAICIHLTKKLPTLEHLADLIHELTHATKLEPKVLKGELDNVEEFVKQRLSASGGEAHAFEVECMLKKEITGDWDSLCSPYVVEGKVSQERILDDLYTGKLSASLTGETYPTMLSKQYKAMIRRKKSALQKD
jgi:hypothetical protein